MTDFEWLRLDEGTTRIRILADLGKNAFHWVRRETASGHVGFDRHPCSGDDCLLCRDEELHPVSQRREEKLYSVIDRADGRIKLFSARGMVRHEIEHAVRAAPFHNKNLSRFDIFITRAGRPPHSRYGVAVDSPRRLLVSEQEAAMDLLSKMVARRRPNCEV